MQPSPLVMLDLCSGFGGASKAMKDRGWSVLKVDIEPRVNPDIVGSILNLPLTPYELDLLWSSPTCTQYSRYDQKGIFPNEPEPDHSLYRATLRIIEEWQPRYWVIENVRGAARFWGPPAYRFGSRLLWTNIPLLSKPDLSQEPLKWNLCSGTHPLKSAKRGYIPYPISQVVCFAVEALCKPH